MNVMEDNIDKMSHKTGKSGEEVPPENLKPMSFFMRMKTKTMTMWGARKKKGVDGIANGDAGPGDDEKKSYQTDLDNQKDLEEMDDAESENEKLRGLKS